MNIVLSLVYNLSILVSLSIISGFIENRFGSRASLNKILQGVLFGLTAIIGMMFPFVLSEGIIFDGRSIVISLSTLFFGPITGIIASGLAIIYRIFIVGGQGTLTGSLVITSAFLIGIYFHFRNFPFIKNRFSALNLYLFSVLVHFVMLVLLLTLPSQNILEAYQSISFTVLVVFPIISMLISKILSDQKEKAVFLEKIKQNETLFRTTFYSIGDGVITADVHSKVISMNPIAEELTGWKESEAKDKLITDIFKIINEETRETVENPINKVLELGKIIGLANHTLLINKNGRQIPIADSGAPIKNSENKIIGVVLVFRDQTNEKERTRELLESERNYREVFNSTNEAIFIDDAATGRMIDVNNAMLKMYGYNSKDEVLRGNIGDLSANDSPYSEKEAQEYIRKTNEVGPQTFEWLAKKKDGSSFWTEVSLRKTEIGGKGRILAVVRDISDRKKHEEELVNLNSRLQSLINTQTNYIIRTDMEGNYTFANEKFLKKFGFLNQELIGSSSLQSFHPEDFPKVIEVTQKCIENPKDFFTVEIRKPSQNGDYFHTEWEFSAITDKDNIPVEIQCIGHDITEKQKAFQIQKSQYNIANAMVNAVDLNSLFEIIKKELGELIDTTNFYIAFYDEQTKMFKINIETDEKDEIEEWSAEDSLSGHVIKSGQPLLINKEEILELANSGKINLVGTLSEIWLGVPLKTNNKIIGIISVQSYNDKNAYDDSSISILEIIANQLSAYLERKRAETELIESEEKFRNFTDASPLAIMIYQGSKWIYTNPAGETITGYSAEELYKQNFWEIVTEEFQDLVKQSAKARLSGKGQNLSYEFSIRSKDNSIKWVFLTGRVIKYLGKPAGLISVVDITDRIRMEKEILKLSQAIKQSSISVMITDIEGKIEYVNPYFTKLTGYSIEEIRQENPRILKSGHQSPEFYKELWSTILAGKEWKGELKNKKKNGDMFWENVTISPIKSLDGNIINFVAIKENITEKKNMIAELVKAKEEAEEMNRIKSYFFANMSHELRTPFMPIMGYAELLTTILTDPEEKEIAESILNSSKRLTETLKNVLDLTRLEFDKVELSFVPVKVENIISEVTLLFKESAKKKNIQLKNILLENSIIVKTEEQFLREILTNLVSNALKFTSEGSIELIANKVKTNGSSFVNIIVKDTGIGIPKEKQSFIYDEFRQVSEGNTRNFQGSGLGLSIVKKYIDLMGAEISLESDRGKGCTFTIKIPEIN